MANGEQLPLPGDVAAAPEGAGSIEDVIAAATGAPVGQELPPMPVGGEMPMPGMDAGMPPGMPPGMDAGMPPGADMLGAPNFDDLLAEIDQFGAGEVGVSAPPAAPDQSLADAFASMRGMNLTPDTPTTESEQRITQLEQQITSMQQNNSRLQQENTKRGITTAISDGISVELKKSGIDPVSKAGKGLSRIVHNATLVSVAQAQAASGSMDVDVATVRKTVQNWAKVFNLVASEIAAHTAAKRRLTTKGAPSNPAAPKADVRNMEDEAFNSAVLSKLRGSA